MNRTMLLLATLLSFGPLLQGAPGEDMPRLKSMTTEQGGPFTIGRVIHSNRQPTLSACIGGVAVFDRALSDDEMKRLATIGNYLGTAK